MCAAVALRDVVGERQDVLVIRVVPFECDIDPDPVAHCGNGDRLGEQRRLGSIEIFDERRNAAFVEQLQRPDDALRRLLTMGARRLPQVATQLIPARSASGCALALL